MPCSCQENLRSSEQNAAFLWGEKKTQLELASLILLPDLKHNNRKLFDVELAGNGGYIFIQLNDLFPDDC